MKKRLIYSFALFALAAASVYAEQPVTAQIPFPFHVGNSTLPAGSYTADTNATPGVLLLRSADCKSTMFVVVNRVQSRTAAGEPKLVFNRYGDEYFLHQVWHAGSDTGSLLRTSRREREIAAATKRGIQTVLASK